MKYKIFIRNKIFKKYKIYIRNKIFKKYINKLINII